MASNRIYKINIGNVEYDLGAAELDGHTYQDIVNLIELALSKFDGCVVKDVEDVFSLDLKVRNFIYEQI